MCAQSSHSAGPVLTLCALWMPPREGVQGWETQEMEAQGRLLGMGGPSVDIGRANRT